MSEEEISLADALGSLTDKQYQFWLLMDSGKHTQIEAYRLAFNCPNAKDTTISVTACELWNSGKFKVVRQAMTEGKVKQAVRTREERIARIERLSQLAEGAGQYNSAIRGEELSGKLEGHYVEKSENIQIKADMTNEALLERILTQYGKDIMINAAAKQGIPQEVVDRVLGTVH